MKNPYVYGYLPLFSIILYSLTFGIFTVSKSIQLFQSIGIYNGMREFLTDVEIRMLLLFVFFLCFFMLFSALKLIGETIHEIGMLFFSKDSEGGAVKEDAEDMYFSLSEALLAPLLSNPLLHY